MHTLQFSISIRATKEKVWDTLWDDKTFRDWANNIDEGLYLAGELQEGNMVQFMSSVNGYGVTSLVEKRMPYELLSFKHQADTMDTGKKAREDEWTGGRESYALKENSGRTILTVVMDTPPELVETFKDRIPKALDRIKTLAEIKV